jgi:cell division protein ZapA
MSNVTLTIGGRDYTVACAQGEEAHVTNLGTIIDAKLSAMGNAVGQSEVRQLLFASLLLADELHEARKTAPAVDQRQMPVLGSALERIADRIENLAEHLETRANSA